MGGTFDFSPQSMGRAGERGFVERRFDLRDAGGTATSCLVVVFGVSCMEMGFEGGNDLLSRSTLAESRFRRRVSTELSLPTGSPRTVSNSEKTKQPSSLPDARF